VSDENQPQTHQQNQRYATNTIYQVATNIYTVDKDSYWKFYDFMSWEDQPAFGECITTLSGKQTTRKKTSTDQRVKKQVREATTSKSAAYFLNLILLIATMMASM